MEEAERSRRDTGKDMKGPRGSEGNVGEGKGPGDIWKNGWGYEGREGLTKERKRLWVNREVLEIAGRGEV